MNRGLEHFEFRVEASKISSFESSRGLENFEFRVESRPRKFRVSSFESSRGLENFEFRVSSRVEASKISSPTRISRPRLENFEASTTLVITHSFVKLNNAKNSMLKKLQNEYKCIWVTIYL